MTRYVLGFAFDEDKSQVALIRKLRPTWQQGLCNGIGGKIEEGELPIDAMVREFKEETGVTTRDANWQAVVLLHADFEVHVFRTSFPDLSILKTVTDEQVVIVDVDFLSQVPCVQNTYWLVPLCADGDTTLPGYRIHGRVLPW